MKAKISASSTENQVRVSLQQELQKRCEENPGYSLRKFAKSLGVSHAALSLMIAGKRRISEKSIRLFASRLHLHLKSSNQSVEPIDNESFQQLSSDHRALRSDWYYEAILCLIDARVAIQPKALAQSLAISEIQVRTCLQTLERLGMISLHKGKVTRHHLMRKLETAIPREAPSRQAQLGFLKRASYVLENDWAQESKFVSRSIAIDPRSLPELLKMIDSFQERFKKKASARSPSQAYSLLIQFFPLSEEAESSSVKKMNHPVSK